MVGPIFELFGQKLKGQALQEAINEADADGKLLLLFDSLFVFHENSRNETWGPTVHSAAMAG